MTDGKLQDEIESYGLDAESLARRLKMSPRTILQYLKPSHVPRREFVDQVRAVLRQVHDESREILAAKNRTQFGTTSFSLYHEVLPITPIEDLPASPILRRRPEPGSFPEFSLAQKWEFWRTEALDRAKGVYKRSRANKSFMPGGHATVLMGNPGAGKTTEMKRLLLYLQGQGMSCVFIPLSVYNREEVEDLFVAARLFYVDKLDLRIPMDFDKLLRLEIAEQRLVLLLDSLDEIDLPERRSSIINQINDLCISRPIVPVFISSRYVKPRLDLDAAMGDALRYHLAGLEPAQVVSYVEMLRKHLFGTTRDFRSLGPRSLLPLLENHIKHMEVLAEHLRNLKESYESSVAGDDLAYMNAERALRSFAGLALPLFLHLHIGLCLERGIAEWSIDSIISRYVDFLLGKWIDSRSENPGQDQRDQGRASLERALAYLGFELSLREYMGEENPTPEEVESLLVAYCRAMDQASRTNEELTAFVRDQIRRAQTAQIIEPDSPDHVRFSAPADVLRDYHVAQFIDQSTAASEANRFRSRSYRPPSEEFPQIDDATYSQFLVNPNLRFLERGHVLYFQSIFENTRLFNLHVRIRFEEAREVPPVRPELFDCTTEQLNQIVPLNLLFLGKALAGDLTDQYKELHDQLRKDLEPIYKKTHFAPVYKALRGIVLPLRERLHGAISEQRALEMINSFDPENEKEVEQMDELWRGLSNARLLIHLARRAQGEPASWMSLSFKRQRLLRRIAYQLRYHAETFDEEAGNWLEDLHKNAEQNVKDMVMATQRILRTTYKRSQKWAGSEWCRYFDKEGKKEQKDLKQQQGDVMRAWFERSDGTRTERFISRVVEDRRFTFGALQRTSSYLRRLVTSPEFNLQDGVATLSELLGTVGDNTEAESKIHIFVRQIADTFWGLQLLMPDEYQLKSLRRKPVRDTRYRSEAILQKLFEKVRPHLPSNDNDEAAGKLNAAGLQPYDFAVEAIWAILYGPNSQDAREEVEP